MTTPTHKVCTKCGESKTLEEFNKWSRGKLGRNPRCRVCSKKVNREWAADNPEKAKKWAVANPGRNRIVKNSHAKASTRELTDYYICSNVLKIPVKDAPPELIEAKRIQLMIHRFINRGVSK